MTALATARTLRGTALLLLAVAFLGHLPDSAAQKPQPDEDALKAAAQALVERLAQGEYAEAVKTFGAPFAEYMTAEWLRATWEDLVRQGGPFRKATGVSLRMRPTGNFAHVTCAFANKEFIARMELGENHEVRSVVFIPAPLGGPGLIRASAAAPVLPSAEGAVGTVTFPVPGTYREQVPLDFAVAATPPDALKGYRWVKRDDGLNWLCEVKVAPPREGALVRWEALVLVGDRAAVPLPPAEKPEVPGEAARWTKPTGCVQSADAAIKAKADELSRGVPDVGAYAVRANAFAATNPLRAELMRSLDARCALESGSSCTGRANLAAALLRARGIPARTLAHLPTWSGPLFEHWLVEYWHPGAGWVWLESSLNQPQPPPWTVVVLNVANPEDEDQAFGSPRTRGVALGAPHLSVRELSPELLPKFELTAAERWASASIATPEVRLRGAEHEVRALFDAARKAHAALAEAAQAGRPTPTRLGRLLEAGCAGTAALTAALRQPPN